MFDYPDFNTAEIDGKRHYLCGEYSFSSITTVLSNTESDEKKQSLEKWSNSIGKENAEEITRNACDRGTTVHKFIELQFLKQPIVFDGVDETYVNTYRSLKFELNNLKPVGLEVALYSKNLGVAGRTDCIGFYKDELCIVDFKTTGRTKNFDDIKDYWLQIAFYAIAHNELYGTNINKGVILMGNDKGLPQKWINNDLSKHHEELVKRVLQYHTQEGITI
jgi:genome maintenance exonuclease 1